MKKLVGIFLLIAVVALSAKVLATNGQSQELLHGVLFSDAEVIASFVHNRDYEPALIDGTVVWNKLDHRTCIRAFYELRSWARELIFQGKVSHRPDLWGSSHIVYNIDHLKGGPEFACREFRMEFYASVKGEVSMELFCVPRTLTSKQYLSLGRQCVDAPHPDLNCEDPEVQRKIEEKGSTIFTRVVVSDYKCGLDQPDQRTFTPWEPGSELTYNDEYRR